MRHAIDAATAAQTIGVRYEGGERYEIAVRGHTILVDQPVHAGGEDLAPTPTELFVASLAGCVAGARRHPGSKRLRRSAA